MSNSSEVETDTMILFWQQPSVFSQWTPSDFTVEGKTYSSAEQWMMAGKARLFGDTTTEAEIMKTTSPKRQKALGRMVEGFSESVWVEKRFELVVQGNIAKFEQNEHMQQQLLETGNKLLVEASPFDRIWGIGLGPDDPKALVQKHWRGENLLGQALMVVRDRIRTQLASGSCANSNLRSAAP